MPIVYVHGVAVRENAGQAVPPGAGPGALLDRLLTSISWEMVAGHLRAMVAPALARDPSTVTLLEAYWGDIGARLAWEGASALPAGSEYPAPSRSHLVSGLRRPVNQLIAAFFGDVFGYLQNRGNASAPGPIPLRVLDTLAKAHAVKVSTGEPLVVLTNSMGGQIVYDIVTHFLPRVAAYSGIRIDFWCSVATQIGLFEEMKLFLESSPEYSAAKGNRVPYPDRWHLGTWWNVWDVDDIVSYSVRDIIEGVEETTFRVGKPLASEHIGYLQEEAFYRMFAERLRTAFPA